MSEIYWNEVNMGMQGQSVRGQLHGHINPQAIGGHRTFPARINQAPMTAAHGKTLGGKNEKNKKQNGREAEQSFNTEAG